MFRLCVLISNRHKTNSFLSLDKPGWKGRVGVWAEGKGMSALGDELTGIVQNSCRWKDI